MFASGSGHRCAPSSSLLSFFSSFFSYILSRRPRYINDQTGNVYIGESSDGKMHGVSHHHSRCHITDSHPDEADEHIVRWRIGQVAYLSHRNLHGALLRPMLHFCVRWLKQARASSSRREASSTRGTLCTAWRAEMGPTRGRTAPSTRGSGAMGRSMGTVREGSLSFTVFCQVCTGGISARCHGYRSGGRIWRGGGASDPMPHPW